jgi:hypothetical protein
MYRYGFKMVELPPDCFHASEVNTKVERYSDFVLQCGMEEFILCCDWLMVMTGTFLSRLLFLLFLQTFFSLFPF